MLTVCIDILELVGIYSPVFWKTLYSIGHMNPGSLLVIYLEVVIVLGAEHPCLWDFLWGVGNGIRVQWGCHVQNESFYAAWMTHYHLEYLWAWVSVLIVLEFMTIMLNTKVGLLERVIDSEGWRSLSSWEAAEGSGRDRVASCAIDFILEANLTQLSSRRNADSIARVFVLGGWWLHKPDARVQCAPIPHGLPKQYSS